MHKKTSKRLIENNLWITCICPGEFLRRSIFHFNPSANEETSSIELTSNAFGFAINELSSFHLVANDKTTKKTFLYSLFN